MKLTEAYTVFNNNLHSMDPQLAEAIDRIIDDKNKQLEKLDQVELAEAKARMEIERLVNFIETLQVVHFKEYQDEKAENKRLREALEFYSNEENYERVANDPDIYVGGYSQPTWEPSWSELDRGLLARKALAGESNV